MGGREAGLQGVGINILANSLIRREFTKNHSFGIEGYNPIPPFVVSWCRDCTFVGCRVGRRGA